jgi:peroxiredoxin
VQLQKDIKSIEAAGIQVIGISYDSPKLLKKFATQQKISFRLLSDPKSRTIKRYGVLNEDAQGRQGFPIRARFWSDRTAKSKRSCREPPAVAIQLRN